MHNREYLLITTVCIELYSAPAVYIGIIMVIIIFMLFISCRIDRWDTDSIVEFLYEKIGTKS